MRRFLTQEMLKKCRNPVGFLLNQKISDFIQLKIIYKKTSRKNDYFVSFRQSGDFEIGFCYLRKKRKSIKNSGFLPNFARVFEK